MTTSLFELHKQGQSIWYDQLSRSLLDSGELDRMIREDGLRGLTSNPTIFEKAISSGQEYETQLRDLSREGRSTMEIYEALVIDDIKSAADCFRPLYEESKGTDGFVSLEVNPHLAHDTKGTIDEALRLWRTVNRPNLMMKVPATPEGIPAVRELLGQGLNVNVTLIFAVPVYEKVMEAYLAAIDARRTKGLPVNGIASVASFFVSRIDSAVDKIIEEKMPLKMGAARTELDLLRAKAASANAKTAYQVFLRVFATDSFRATGAHVQRPLWASTGTKNPRYSDVLYVDGLIGPDTVNTVPPQTYDAFRDHGRIERTLDADLEESRTVIAGLELEEISLKDVTDRLTTEGVKSFADSFDKLIASIEERRLAATRAVGAGPVR